MDDLKPAAPRDAWDAAASLTIHWLEHRDRVEELLGRLRPGLPAVERARCQALVYGTLRHFGRIDAAIRRHVRREPRGRVRAVLLLAGWELIDHFTGQASGKSEADDGRVARIAHHAVERAKAKTSASEAALVNAVVRKLAADLSAGPPPRLATAQVLAEYFSHPVYLVERWLARFGAEATRKLLEWNQKPAPVYLRWRAGPAAGPPPEWLIPTAWPGFFEVPAEHWSSVAATAEDGRSYIQDPATRLAVELLAPVSGETVLDACASPGGKAVLTADTMGTGHLVALDLPGKREERLRENLAKVSGVKVSIVTGNLLRGARARIESAGAPTEYPAVMLDVPCSNNGVMRHRVDVKWRLSPGDFSRHAAQQLALVESASSFVAPGGRIVYSTCSIDPEENTGVVDAFLEKSEGRFALEKSVISVPWESGHDGAAAFLLCRVT